MSCSADEQVAEACAILRAGGLVGVPTETVYGLAADARNPVAIERLYEVKGRPAGRPLPVLVAGLAQAAAFTPALGPDVTRLAEAFWPGPLTLVVPAAVGLPPKLTGGGPTIGLRVPDHPLTLALLRAFGSGLATPSANRSGGVSPTSAQAVRAELGGDVDLVLDGGGAREGIESTVVDLSGAAPRILRLGALDEAQIARVLGGPAPQRSDGRGTTAFRVSTPWEWVPRETLSARAAQVLAAGAASVAVLATELALPPAAGLHLVPLPADESARARAFYALLRDADALGAAHMLIEAPPDTLWGRVLRQRLGG